MRALLCFALAATACTADDPPDVVGPYTGEARRFVVDSIALPANRDEVFAIAADLDGDGETDNHVGQMASALAAQGDLTRHGDDMIAAGAIASSVIVTADDLTADATVSVRYLGADGAASVEVGGRFEDGRFRPNRTATTRVPGAATVVLPVLVDADPSALDATGLEIELAPDGAGGYDAIVRGIASSEAVAAETRRAVAQMLATNPGDHLGFMALLDQSRDWTVTPDELAANAVLQSLLEPDVTYGGAPGVSFAFRAHLAPCADGRCAAAPADACHDRVTDGDESDVDCGGGCRACAAGSACASGDDCESGACDAGTCAPGTCADGRRDGFEVDVDCGERCGATCALGARCFNDDDCATGQCGEPYVCPPDAWLCFDYPQYGTCQ